MGIDDESSSPRVGFRSCRRRHTDHRVSFPRAGCGKSACPVRRAGTGNRATPNRTEATMRKLRQQPPGDYRHCACSRLYSHCLLIAPYLIVLGTAPVIFVKKAGWCAGLACGILLVFLLPILHRLFFWALSALGRRLTREKRKAAWPDDWR